MSDNFNTLSNRLLNRAPSIGILLAEQFINDSFQTIQSRKEWSWRRRFGTFAPPDIYQTGVATTNVAAGSPTLVTGSGTTWTQAMVGRQIRIGGLNYPFYTINSVLSATQLLLGQPWAGPDLTNQAYTILQSLYPLPDDFGWFYAVVSIRDNYRLWTNVSEAELALYDPQRNNFGQTLSAVYRSYTPNYNGYISPVIPVTSPTNPAPVSTTTFGYSGVADNTFIVKIATGGVSGTATFQWMVAGQLAFQPALITSDTEIDLPMGLQLFFPTGVTYVANDLFVINCRAQATQGPPVAELWPAPTFSGFLYPYIYTAKEYALTQQQPQLPPSIASRGEILIEMGMQKACEYPGPDFDRPNPAYSLKQAAYHGARVADLLVDLERNDSELSQESLMYQDFPMAPAPWADASYQQRHSPWLNA